MARRSGCELLAMAPEGVLGYLSALMNLAAFLARYPPQAPQKEPANADETRLLTEREGVRRLERVPALNEVGTGRPERKGDPGCSIWVIDRTGIPYILERTPVVPALESGLVKHSNLTGNQPASCGGEIWFETEQATHLYVNGCSGRYAPTTPDQLEDACQVLRGLGFHVTSFGWDQDAKRPHTVLR